MRDWLSDKRSVATAVVVAGVWLGSNALGGGTSVVDWVIAFALLAGGFFHQRTRKPPDDSDTSGIYGPPS